MAHSAIATNAEPSSTVARARRVAFLTPMPSPYVQDLFEAMHRDARLDIHVFYMEMAAPDTHWGNARMPSYASLLPGIGLQAWGTRTHINLGATRTISRWAPDVVVVGGYASLTCQLAMRWLRRSRVPWIFWAERPGVVARGRVVRLMRHLAMRPAVRWPMGIAAVGEMARQVYASCVKDPRTVHSIPYCCELGPFFSIGRGGRAPGDPSKLSILYCGQLIERKGVDLLIEAFSRVARRRSNLTLTLVGTGPLKELLSSRIDAALRDRVHFAGFHPVSDLPAYFAAGDAFILPSRHDGWGVVINQAIAAGLPVIASDAVGAAVELVRPDENGVIVPAGDVERLAEAIEYLAADPARLARMSHASRQLADQMTPAAIVDRWVRLVEETCPRRRS